jgi:hypothetical protein
VQPHFFIQCEFHSKEKIPARIYHRTVEMITHAIVAVLLCGMGQRLPLLLLVLAPMGLLLAELAANDQGRSTI